MWIVAANLFFFIFILTVVPSQVCAKAIDEDSLYHIVQPTIVYLFNNPKKSELPSSFSPDNLKGRKNIILSEKDLLTGTEVKDSNGNRYLKIPYYSDPKKTESSSYYVLPLSARSTKGEIGPSYKQALRGEHETLSHAINNQDRVVYLDRPAGVVASLTLNPGDTWRDCRFKPEFANIQRKCTGWPSSKDKLHIIGSKIVQINDPLSGAKSDEVFYLVKTTYKRKSCSTEADNMDDADPEPIDSKCSSKTYNRIGWIQSKDVIDFQREDTLEEDIIAHKYHEMERLAKKAATAKKKVCPPAAKKDPVISATKEIIKNDNHMSEVLGECVATPKQIKKASDKNPDEIPLDTHLRKYWEGKNAPKVGGYTKDQLFAIDSLARALFGEMRGCAENSTGYLKIIARVMMNRSKAIQTTKSQVDVFMSPPGLTTLRGDKNMSLEEIFPYVVSSPGQISSLSSYDPNINVVLCPKNFEKDSLDDYAWRKCTAVAEEAIMNFPKLQKETPDVNELFYSSRVTPFWAKDMERVDHITVKNEQGDLKLNNPACVILWRAKKLPETQETIGNKLLVKLQKMLSFNLENVTTTEKNSGIPAALKADRVMAGTKASKPSKASKGSKATKNFKTPNKTKNPASLGVSKTAQPLKSSHQTTKEKNPKSATKTKMTKK